MTTPARSVLLVLLLSALVLPDAVAQRWSWPENPENLKVLPETISSRELSSTMRGFTRALGVRCSHCHVGEEGQSLSTYDFASDDKQAKETARQMMRMVATINGEHLADLGDDRMAVTCVTCHRGQDKPRMLEDVLAQTLDDEGIPAMVEQYHALRERYYGSFVFDFRENTLNNLGYAYLGQGNTDAALALFMLNVEAFPASASAYDSLAEGYLTRGDTERAIVYYQKSLELDPGNDNAAEKLRELRDGQ